MIHDSIRPYLATLKLCLYAAIASVVLFGGFKAYRMGYEKAELLGQAAIDELMLEIAQTTAIESAIQAAASQAARERERELVAKLTQEAEAREALIKEAHEEALADRHAGRECLSADSLRRINKATPGNR